MRKCLFVLLYLTKMNSNVELWRHLLGVMYETIYLKAWWVLFSVYCTYRVNKRRCGLHRWRHLARHWHRSRWYTAATTSGVSAGRPTSFAGRRARRSWTRRPMILAIWWWRLGRRCRTLGRCVGVPLARRHHRQLLRDGLVARQVPVRRDLRSGNV